MKIFAKKTFEFRGSSGETYKTIPNSLDFAEAPEWVKLDPLFKWALADGDITVIGDKSEEKEIEKQLADGDKSEEKEIEKPDGKTDKKK